MRHYLPTTNFTMSDTMTRRRFNLVYATLGSQPVNEEWDRQVKLGNIIQEDLAVSLPISLLDLKRGFTSVPNILYDALYPETSSSNSGFTIHNNLVNTEDGWLHTHTIRREYRRGMLQQLLETEPRHREKYQSWLGEVWETNNATVPVGSTS